MGKLENIQVFQNNKMFIDFQWEGCPCLASTSASILGSVLEKEIRRSGSTLIRERNMCYKEKENSCSHI